MGEIGVNVGPAGVSETLVVEVELFLLLQRQIQQYLVSSSTQCARSFVICWHVQWLMSFVGSHTNMCAKEERHTIG
jgi:hypothetical protein